MKQYKLKSFKKGWIIGDFSPTLVYTKRFEFAVKYYQSGDSDIPHYHKIADEFTVIVSGRYSINGKEYGPGSIIHFTPQDVSTFTCIESGATAVVKIPSVKGDKYAADEK